MTTTWNLEKIQSYIKDKIQEGHNLEYKSANALSRTDGKITDISKDVSSMANAAGGAIVYGLKEFDEKANKHLPEIIDGIIQTDYSREWLDQIITSNIRPPIKGVIIYPVEFNAKENLVVYVVEIPQSTTAHQARDFRYWRRSNFTIVRMTDDQIRDVMNRGIAPDVEVEFGYDTIHRTSEKHHYVLNVLVRNLGPIVVNNYKLIIHFPDFNQEVKHHEIKGLVNPLYGNLTINHHPDIDFEITCRSSDPLFPEDEIAVGKTIGFNYHITEDDYQLKDINQLSLKWTLFADNMPPKRGEVPFKDLNEF